MFCQRQLVWGKEQRAAPSAGLTTYPIRLARSNSRWAYFHNARHASKQLLPETWKVLRRVTCCTRAQQRYRCAHIDSKRWSAGNPSQFNVKVLRQHSSQRQISQSEVSAPQLVVSSGHFADGSVVADEYQLHHLFPQRSTQPEAAERASALSGLSASRKQKKLNRKISKKRLRFEQTSPRYLKGIIFLSFLSVVRYLIRFNLSSMTRPNFWIIHIYH